MCAAIDSLKTGKAPGPDGLLAGIFKKFKAKLLASLLDMSTESFEKGTPPPTSQRAALNTLLPKPGKSWNKCANLRLLSLLNVERKILWKEQDQALLTAIRMEL